jgi:hypothetical protein
MDETWNLWNMAQYIWNTTVGSPPAEKFDLVNRATPFKKKEARGETSERLLASHGLVPEQGRALLAQGCAA